MAIHDDPVESANPLVYSSPLIHERRRRILKETRKLISEKGLANFGIRELCARADVAQRTLYNAFSSKERVAALAIKEAFDELRQSTNYSTQAATIEGLIDRVITVNTRNLKAKNYALAVATIYFSPTTPQDVWEMLRKMGTAGITEVLENLAASRQLEEWVDIDEVAINFSNLSYAIINEWCLGRLTDRDYLRRLVDALLLLLLSATKGKARKTAERRLLDIRPSGALPVFPAPPRRGKAGVA